MSIVNIDDVLYVEPDNKSLEINYIFRIEVEYLNLTYSTKTYSLRVGCADSEGAEMGDNKAFVSEVEINLFDSTSNAYTFKHPQVTTPGANDI